MIACAARGTASPPVPRQDADSSRGTLRPVDAARATPAVSIVTADDPPDIALPAAGPGARRALGLYRADDFTIARGDTPGATAPPQALWYFAHETIGIPATGRPVATGYPAARAGCSACAAVHGRSDVHETDSPELEFPPIAWIAEPSVVEHASVARDGAALTAAGATLPLRLVPKIALNRAWFNDASAAFFTRREVTMRGHVDAGAFVARTLWPEDFRFAGVDRVTPLPPAATPALGLRALVREPSAGGARSPYSATTLWRRPGRDDPVAGRAVLAFILNGAQGDDDEAHGGHFALVTGRVAADGAIGDWLVNNFYTLDSESEKGIIAAPVPLDNYLADLNAGQAWYRPSCMLVAVLSSPRAAVLAQNALAGIYQRFYRHEIVYAHPTMNCAGITVDALRALGWPIPARGPTNRALAWASLPAVAARERSLAKAMDAFDYLNEDLTRLLPAVALEEIFASLVSRVDGSARAAPSGMLERMLAKDVEALALLRFPQFPSSRAWGTAAAVSIREIRERLPQDRRKLQIIPVPPRPFPPALRAPGLRPPPLRPSEIAVYVYAALTIVGIPWIAWRLWQRRHGVCPRAAVSVG